MKRLFALLMCFSLMLTFSACGGGGGGEDSSPAPSQSADSASGEPVPASGENGTNALVIYFSCTGNTEAVAETIAGVAGADIYEIVPQVPYTDADLDYRTDNCRANLEMNDAAARPAIAGTLPDLSGYDTVYLGFPIWWGTIPKIINTYLDTADLSGKTVMPFCTSGGSGISAAVSAIKSEEPGADVTDGLRISGSQSGDCADTVSDWIARAGQGGL